MTNEQKAEKKLIKASHLAIAQIAKEKGLNLTLLDFLPEGIKIIGVNHFEFSRGEQVRQSPVTMSYTCKTSQTPTRMNTKGRAWKPTDREGNKRNFYNPLVGRSDDAQVINLDS